MTAKMPTQKAAMKSRVAAKPLSVKVATMATQFAMKAAAGATIMPTA